MTDSANRAYTTHDSASLLLPWYVNGSLDDKQRELVDKHLAVCLTCRSEVNTHRRIARAVQTRDAASIGSDVGFEQIRRRIQSDRRSLFDRVRDWLGHETTAPVWIWASGFAVAASIFMMVPLQHGTGRPATLPAEFRTLSSDDGHIDVQENSLRLIFSAGIEDETRQDILRTIHAISVTAPSAHGMITVQVPDGKQASALVLLRDRTEVLLAEPVFRAKKTTGGD